MELPNGPRPYVLAVYFLVASVLLYFGIAIPMLDPGGYHESRFEVAMPYLLFVLPGLLVSFRIAWVLRQPASPESKGRPLWLTMLLSMGGAVVGAVLISVLLFRQHWAQLFWNR